MMRWFAAGVLLVLVVGCAAHDPGRPDLWGSFDPQAHRGGAGLVSENTLPAFSNALELGVRTLEMDVQITRDGHAVITHDRDPDPSKCVDTAPAFPGDPQFPYVPGPKFIHDLTLAQVRTIDCGSRKLAQFPQQRTAPGARMPLLSEVFALVRSYHADSVMMNVELKVQADAPQETASRDDFVRIVTDEIRRAHIARQVTIESFDWGSLEMVHRVAPELPLVALTDGDNLQVGKPGVSPWLGGRDIDVFDGTVPEKAVVAAASFGVEAISPVHGNPQDGSVADPGYVPFTTPELVAAAHWRHIRVVPWTVDDPATMNALIDRGVDGLITNRPDVLRGVLAARHQPLPQPFPPPPHP